ncbi:hypothetical protein TNCV_4073141 [Trichonephila clavipes]|uniref:Uncharacterized protein n=1 Tax=Trichonephila clavipes TaxID=2585209 RepID=A0A8X7BFQ4_TRICX|nr:hypothetical protein TNCV_4073141 [Trichonephila clavipes]
MGLSDMGVARCEQQWITKGKVYHRGGSGCPRVTSSRREEESPVSREREKSPKGRRTDIGVKRKKRR